MKISENEILLLQASLLEKDQAFKAYQVWKKNIDFETISSNNFALLPVLYKHILEDHEDELSPRIKGVYRQIWLRQQHLGQQQKTLLETLKQAGLETNLLDDPSTDVLAQADLYVNAEVNQIKTALHNSPVKLEETWNQDVLHLRLENGSIIRILRRTTNTTKTWLHRLELTSNDLIWLVRVAPHWKAHTDWYQTAKQNGLRLRLYKILEVAQKAGILEQNLDEWKTQGFSSFDQAQYKRVFASSKLERLVFAWQAEQHRGNQQRFLGFVYQYLRRSRIKRHIKH